MKDDNYFGMAVCIIVDMFSLTMRSRIAKQKAHVVELNEPVLKEEDNESDMAK